MGERGPVGRFIRRVLISSAVWATVLWGINTWGVFDRARAAGAGVADALGRAAGNALYWPLFYVLLLPFVGFASFMWEARKFGWRLGKQLTARPAAGREASSTASAQVREETKGRPIEPR